VRKDALEEGRDKVGLLGRLAARFALRAWIRVQWQIQSARHQHRRSASV